MRRANNFRPGMCLLTVCFLTAFLGVYAGAAEKKGSAPKKEKAAEAAKETSGDTQKNTTEGTTFQPLRIVGGIPDTLPIPGDARPYAESRYAKEIDRALAFMVFKCRESGRWIWYVLLDYLQRQYDLPERYSFEFTASSVVMTEENDLRDRLLRMSDPAFMLPLEKIEESSGAEYFLQRALYCKDYPIEDELVAQMADFVADESNYVVSPVAFAAVIMRQGQCVANTRNYMRLRGTLGVLYRERLTKEGIRNAFSAEALAMLKLLKYEKMLQENWLPEAVSYQNEDGGWADVFRRSNPGSSAPRATLFMLWAMLQDAMPDVEEVPLLRPGAVAEGEAAEVIKSP